MAEEEKKYTYGVSRAVFRTRIDNYLALLNLTREDIDKQINFEVEPLYEEVQKIMEREAEAKMLSASSDAILQIEQERKKLEERIKKLEADEKIRAYDVVLELDTILKQDFKPDSEYIDYEKLQKIIGYYKKEIVKKEQNPAKIEIDPSKLEDEVEKITGQIVSLQQQKNQVVEKKVIKSEYQERIRKISDLKAKIENRRAMIATRGDSLHENRFVELEEWEKELASLETGIEELAQKDAKLQDLEEKIDNREAMIAAGKYELQLERYEELEAWKASLESLGGPREVEIERQVVTNSEVVSKIAALEKLRTEKLRLIKELKTQKVDLTDFATRAGELRLLKHCLEELESIAKENTLIHEDKKFEYPEIEPEIDFAAFRIEMADSVSDMVRQFYGDKEFEKARREKIKNFKSHIVQKKFRYIDEKGQSKIGTYQTIEDYEGKELDIAFLNLQEYQERLERKTMYEAGDVWVYSKLFDGRGEKIDPQIMYEDDTNYLETNNSKYNRNRITYTNALTLGKYGEKVDYLQMQKEQPVRNILRGVGNVGLFLRNNITAPISRGVGKFIVAPIYKKVTNADKEETGVYANKYTHRYVARRDYFASKGEGYFASRFHSIFNAKEGNKAVLAAGRQFIFSQVQKKYQELAVQDAERRKIAFEQGRLDEKIAMIRADMEATTSPENKLMYNNMLTELQQASIQIEADRIANERKVIQIDIKTDAVDMDQHDIANKENVTRTVALANVFARYGIRKFIGPKLKNWLLEHTKQTETYAETIQVPETTQQWVDTTYRTEIQPQYGMVQNNDLTMSEVISANTGKRVEGFYSVHGGERGGKMRLIRGNEKITGVFQRVGKTGTGLSDRVGLTAPRLTDRTFSSNLLTNGGFLNQDISVETLLDSLGTGTVDMETLDGVYVSVGDAYWVKLSDLCGGMTKQVQTGEITTQVVDIPGHWESVTKNVMKTVNKTRLVDNPRVLSALKTLGVFTGAIRKGTIIDDIYENTRETTSEATIANTQFDYNYKYGRFTGRKDDDIRRADKAVENAEAKNAEEKNRYYEDEGR